MRTNNISLHHKFNRNAEDNTDNIVNSCNLYSTIICKNPIQEKRQVP